MKPCEHCGQTMVHPRECPNYPSDWPDKPRRTPGKWIFHQPWGGFSKITDDDGKLIFGVTAGLEGEMQPVEISEANWKRLDSCVAAMEQIGHPEKVKELIEAVKTLQEDFADAAVIAWEGAREAHEERDKLTEKTAMNLHNMWSKLQTKVEEAFAALDMEEGA